MLGRLNHVAIAVPDLAAATARYRDTLGAQVSAPQDLPEHGVTVVFVTGRPIRWMDALWEHVGGHGLAVVSNGGILYDVHARAVRKARTIPVEVGLKVADILRHAVPGTTFAMERVEGFARERLLDPLGLRDTTWDRDPSGATTTTPWDGWVFVVTVGEVPVSFARVPVPAGTVRVLLDVAT